MDVSEIANNIGISVEAAKLMLTVYLGFGLAFIHRLFIFNKPKTLQNICFILCGFSLLYWNYGWGALHSLFCILMQWVIFHTIGTSIQMAACSFVFQMGYLLLGYYYTTTEHYDITWTMPHCILMMRLIGLAFDVYDGHKNEKLQTPEQKFHMISEIPSLLETIAFCYFYGTFIIGPQSSLKKYRSLIAGELTDVPGKLPNSVKPAIIRYACGSLLLGVHVFLDVTFPTSPFYGDQLQTHSFLWLSFIILMRAYVFFAQYISIWMINEASCILCGLGYKKENGKVAWDAVRNVRCTKFFMATSYQEMIESFNLNTNNWVARYVFKRLRFLGNKSVSHLCALFFLAIWHGFHEGYFFTFFFEYCVITSERPAREVLKESKFIQRWKSSSLSWLYKLIGWLYVKVNLGYCIIAFWTLKYQHFIPIYNSVYWYGHIFYFSIWLFCKVYSNVSEQQSKKL